MYNNNFDTYSILISYDDNCERAAPLEPKLVILLLPNYCYHKGM